MEDDAGGVDDTSGLKAPLGGGLLPHGFHDIVQGRGRNAVGDGGAGRFQVLTYEADNGVVRVGVSELPDQFMGQHFIHTWQVAESVGHGCALEVIG